MEPAAETLVWNTVTTDAAFPRHVANAQLRMLQARPGTIVLEVVLAAAVLLSLTDWRVGAGGRALRRRRWSRCCTVMTRRQLRRLLPAGSVYRAALGADTLFTEAPLGNAALPYGVFGRVRVSRHVVLLQNSRGKQWLPLPREVFPGQLLDELQERIRVAPPAAEVRSAERRAAGAVRRPAGRRIPGYPTRVSRAFVAESLVTKGWARLLALLLTGVVAVAVVTDASAGTGLMFVALFVALVVFVVRGRRALTASTDGEADPCRQHCSRSRSARTQLWIQRPAAMSGEMSYAAFRGVRVRGDVVLLRTVQAGQFVALPAQLFSEQSLRELRSRIAGAQPVG